MSQIKSKFIEDAAIIEAKILLENGAGVRAKKFDGSPVKLIQISASDEVSFGIKPVEIAALETQVASIISNADPAALDSLTEIVTAFQAADANLNGAITSLASSLAADIASEASARAAADSALSSDLAAEVSRATAAESALASDLAAEVSRATSAESGLASDIASEASARAAADASLASDLAAETSARAAADASLASDISAEVTRATAAESALSSRATALEGKSLEWMPVEKFVLSSGDITAGYVTLSFAAVQHSIQASVDRLLIHQGDDFTVSTVGGVTRLTFTGPLVGAGAEKLQANDVIRVQACKKPL